MASNSALLMGSPPARELRRRPPRCDARQLVAQVLLHRQAGGRRLFTEPLPDGVVQILDVQIHIATLPER